MTTYIIEDCEPEVYEWSLVEYTHISSIVGKKNLWITNTSAQQHQKLSKRSMGSVTDMDLDGACVLDPHATETLTPAIAKQYKYFIFGGIMGNDPPSKKTQHFLTNKGKWPAYNLGPGQMPTDNAVYVTKQIVEGKKLEDIRLVQSIEIVLGEHESVTLPFTYVVVDGKPLIHPKLIEILQREDTF